MDYFAGLDISRDETHVCVLDREGVGRRGRLALVNQRRSPAKAPGGRRIAFETGICFRVFGEAPSSRAKTACKVSCSPNFLRTTLPTRGERSDA